MENFQLTNLICFSLIIVVAEIVFYFVNGIIKKKIVRKWVNRNYPPLQPGSFSERWVNDLQYYIILTFLVIYSFWGSHNIWTVAAINICLIVYAIIHLTMRWLKINSFFKKLRINEKGVHFPIKEMRPDWDKIYLMGVLKWLKGKFKELNDQIINGITMCRQNRFEGLYYLEKIDVKFSRDEFINMDSQSLHSNIIFLLHLFAVIATNAVLLFDMTRSGMVTAENFTHNIRDVLYVILQVFSTVGFGEVYPTSSLGKWFFIIMFLQVITTIVLGVAYKEFALNRAANRFEDQAKFLNFMIEDHKKNCIDWILKKEMPFESLAEFHEVFPLFHQSVYEKMREFIKQKDDGQKSETAQSQNCVLSKIFNLILKNSR